MRQWQRIALVIFLLATLAATAACESATEPDPNSFRWIDQRNDP